MSDLSPYYFDLLAQFLKKESGIILKPEKSYSLRSKLQPLAREWGYDGLNDLVTHVYRERNNPEVVDAILNALTIKETSFFRDSRPFEVMEKRIIPELAERRGDKELKVWSAACSTGQEAVSLAIALREVLPPERADRCMVVGTDVSDEAISRAKKAVYSELEMRRGASPEVRRRYFEQVEGGYRPRPEILHMIRYREMNILEPDFPLSRFDIILCRNVLIYFDDEGKRKALETVHHRMANDGYLFTGAGEDAQRMDARFERERVDGVQCFRKNEDA
ncbi:CheR family methyltransferase [Thiohalorhabdus sp. Cl-TMA]|uniref:protein-glutamate O-methyltransferase n=1 Tax=Thiohalorhabdus methylotrophus TaxID=3242694 RepID=A0ABV4TXZ8_9GAMM